jgi:Ca-activated chloride channel family protein
MKARLLIPFLLAVTASAAGSLPEDPTGFQNVRPADVGTGSLLLRSDIAPATRLAPTIETQVQIHVTGMVGRTRVIQRFENPTAEWVEGVYVFPLPERAALDTLRMVIGERVIEGQIREREQARKTYETAKREGKKASLLEQERPNIFTISVAQIGPAEEVRVELEYQEDIRYDQGRFTLRFPMVVGPRYIPGLPSATTDVAFSGNGWAGGTNLVPDAGRITPPVLPPSSRQQNPVKLSVELDVGMPLTHIESPSHRLRVKQESGFRYEVNLPDENVADRDFVLGWTPVVKEAPSAALFTEDIEGDRYVLLMLVPPHQESEGSRIPRETIFVIDTSGSMHGTSIEQARRALLLALDRLRPEDAFNVIQFNSTTSKLFASPVIATPRSVEEAKGYVRGLGANGGTEMLSALAEAFSQRSPDEAARVRQVIFITDGSVGNEDELFHYIHERLSDRRLFTVGIGSAPNSHFMTRAAQFGRGTFTFIGVAQEVTSKMGDLFRKLESPVLSHLELSFEDDQAEVWPKRIPDLYLGEPLVVAARVTRDGGLDVRGHRGEQPWGVSFQLRGGAARNGVSKLWARRKIASLMDSITEGADRDRVRRDVIDVALRHHLVSKFTSLVAVDVTPSAPKGAPTTRPIPTHLPAGWSHEHVFGPLPQGATAAEMLMLLGFLSLILGLLIHWSADGSCKEERSVFSS